MTTKFFGVSQDEDRVIVDYAGNPTVFVDPDHAVEIAAHLKLMGMRALKYRGHPHEVDPLSLIDRNSWDVGVNDVNGSIRLRFIPPLSLLLPKYASLSGNQAIKLAHAIKIKLRELKRRTVAR